MPVSKYKKLKKQVQQQDDEVYGEETATGSSPRPDAFAETDEVLEETVGTDLKGGEEFDLAEEVEKDEKDRRTKPKISVED